MREKMKFLVVVFVVDTGHPYNLQQWEVERLIQRDKARVKRGKKEIDDFEEDEGLNRSSRWYRVSSIEIRDRTWYSVR